MARLAIISENTVEQDLIRDLGMKYIEDDLLEDILICPWSHAFSLFIAPIAHIVSSYGLLQQQYADDTQLYGAISKVNYYTPVAKLELCLSTLHIWFCY